MRVSREISLGSSLHRASTDALIIVSPCSIRGSDGFQTTSNEAYNVVRQTGRTTEGDYEVPNHPSPQPVTTAPAGTTAGDSLYECV